MTINQSVGLDHTRDLIKAEIQNSISVKKAILEDASLLEQINRLVSSTYAVLKNSGKVIFAGNGGSFADAQHLSAEFTSRFLFDRSPLASVALGTNSSAMSAIGNDYGYEHVFAREFEAIARPTDIFIPISTSGNSANIIAAVKKAKEVGVQTFAFTGHTGGQLKSLCECLCMPSSETARIQEAHILVGHIFCGLVERFYFAGVKQ